MSGGFFWEYFYDPMGKALVRLYRVMGRLCTTHRALRSRRFFYYDDPFHRRDGIVAYRRSTDAQNGGFAEDMVVILNFADRDVEAWIQWPADGTWSELIDALDYAQPDLVVAQPLEWKPVRVSSNYGAVYLHRNGG